MWGKEKQGPPTTRSSAPLRNTWLFALWLFTRQSRGVFLDAFAVTAAHSRAQRDGRFAVAVAQTISGFEGLAPALGASAIHQVELALVLFESRSLDAEETDLAFGIPVGAEEGAGVFDEVDIELCRR